MNRHFLEVKMVNNKNMKKCSAPLAIQEMQIKQQ